MRGLATRGAVLPARELEYVTRNGCLVAEAVGPHLGARIVRLDVVRVPANGFWRPGGSAEEENVVVVFEGAGRARAGRAERPVGRADTVYAPTGEPYGLTAGPAGLTAYVWRTALRPGRSPGPSPRRFSTLWNGETQLRGFTGVGAGPEASQRTATMNFLFWPGTGSPQLCLHCGVMNPGEYFNVHVHPESEEAFIAFEGEGQLHLDGRWYDARPGDVLYAPPGVPHGTRHPVEDPGAPRFATCGGPTPFDPVLYERAGVSAKVR
ncbi:MULTISPECIES: cupin domain-containing protein [unclassified Streptomyces]|uniref:cupin domain-containing protein n=1 Tax=unclassified Streptomyces TaxID=2593676 RepID=UPI0022B65D5B|nr:MULTISPECIES: cupin domain-containing protein [unclassified Streptomyces]MCZ7414670.1 cupin domain-containing protein [Streptomyces sp. WMMC897]MCZ7431599.1 cupin domain-containing protein [Streptomyces sp. WMMC1477]